MRVAVVVPCFDDGTTLPETLASLDAQEPHELIVVDDASTDPRTLTVLRELEDAGTRVLRRTENGGLSAARMSGVSETTAPYVFPLDADDLLAPGALTRLADALDADDRLAVTWGDVELFGAIDLKLRLPDTLDPWLFTFVNEVPGTCLYRRTSLLEAGGWRLAGGYEDWDLWLSFAERGYAGRRVPGPMLRYRQRTGRMNEAAIGDHTVKVGRLRELHPALFAGRRRLSRSSPEPWRVRMTWPLIERLPGVSLWTRHRLCRVVRDPRTQLASARRTA